MEWSEMVRWYYNHALVQVTAEGIRAGESRFALQEVAWVTVRRRAPQFSGDGVLHPLPLVLAVLSLVCAAAAVSALIFVDGAARVGWAGLASVVAIGSALQVLRAVPRRYEVWIGCPDGREEVLHSTFDVIEANNLARAVQRAVEQYHARRGRAEPGRSFWPDDDF
jgi:hypothetical protein